MSSSEQHVSSSPRNRNGASPGLRPLIAVGLVVLLGVLGAVAALVYSATSPKLYASESVIRVFNPYRLSGAQFGQVDPITITTLELQYATSKSLRTDVDDALDGVEFDRVEWTAQSGAATLTVRCLAGDAKDSQTCAKTFADVYSQLRSEEVVAPLQKQQESLDEQIELLNQKVKTLQNKIKDQPGPEGRPSDANRGRLAQQGALLAQISNLSEARQTAQNQASTLSQNYEVVSAPSLPDAPAKPTTKRNLAVGAVAGLLLGMLLTLALARYRSPAPRA